MARVFDGGTPARSLRETYTLRNITAEIAHRLRRLRQRPRPRPRPQDDEPRSAPYDDRHARRVGRFYDAHHAQFMEVYGPVIQAFRTADVTDLLTGQIARIGLAAGQRVLDAGCGVGAPAVHFATHARVLVDGITISTAQHAAARRLVAEAGLDDRVRIVLGDFHRLPDHFPPGAYDIVYFLESFGHSRDKPRLIRTCWDMLRPGGTIFIKDLFRRVPLRPEHAGRIAREIRRIDEAYHYEVGDLTAVLDALRGTGFLLASLAPVEVDLATFEDLAISNVFQELTGLAPIDDWDDYVFPVDFFEIRGVKPEFDATARLDRHYLQTRYHRARDGSAAGS